MNLRNITNDSFTYTKEGVFSNISRWLKLIIALIPLGIPLNGYAVRIYRNAQPAPEIDNLGTLFIDGLKLMVIGLFVRYPGYHSPDGVPLDNQHPDFAAHVRF